MSKSYNAFDHRAWREAGLKDFGDFAEMVEYINQEDFGDFTEGEWYYEDEEKLTIYTGTFGNYNAPGASSYTNAEVYDDYEDFRNHLNKLQASPEYLETDDLEGIEDDDDTGWYEAESEEDQEDE